MRTIRLPSLLLAFVSVAAIAGTSRSAVADVINTCRATPQRADALDFPSKHAWDLFMTLVHPAKPINIARGEPDCSKPIGAPGSTSLWETWRFARTEVFLPDGSEPPEWRDLRLPRGYLGTIPDPTPSIHVVRPLNASTRNAKSLNIMTTESRTIRPFFDPFPDNGVFNLQGGIGETHVNRSTYDFIRDNCLFSIEGLQRYAKARLDGKMPEIKFPTDSIEVKAVWLRFSDTGGDSEIKKQYRNKYYVAKDDAGNEYGLSSFHILTKDTPNWFWATFHHIDNPKTPYERLDTYGRPKDLDGTTWANYILGGTQTDFVTSIGEPIALADYYIEYQFDPSSCMTCHAMANGSPDNSKGPQQTIATGIPNASTFKKNGKEFYMQTDFVWSIPFRAQAEKQAPPPRCVWQ